MAVSSATETTGWQADGSYVPCKECGWEPPPPPRNPPPGVALDVFPRTPGTATHHGDCPVVALPKDVQRKLYDDLAEMDRVRRRGAAEAANFVIY